MKTIAIAINEDRFQKADQGRGFWIENRLDEYDFVLLLISGDASLDAQLLDCFHRKLKCEDKRGAVLSANTINKENELSSCSYFPVQRQIIKDILQLYCMYEFTDRLIIGSLDKPHSNRLFNLLELDGFTRSDIVEQVLFQM